MSATILRGDVLSRLPEIPSASVQMCITSPPYWGLRSYLPKDHPDKAKEIGSEATPAEYVAKLVAVFREVRRVLRDDGTLWLNLGDSYAAKGATHVAAASEAQETGGVRHRTVPDGLKEKDLVGIPWSVAFALRDDGWYLRSDIIWAKGVSRQGALETRVAQACAEAGLATADAARVLAAFDPYVGNCMPSSVQDRPTSSHEYLFLLSKSKKYYYDSEAVREEAACPGDTRHLRSDRLEAVGADNEDGGSRRRTGTPTSSRNIRSVWTVPTSPFPGAHFATFPVGLVTPCVQAGSSERGACSACGTPWERHVVKGKPAGEQRAACGADASGGYAGESTKDHAAAGVQDASAVKARILAGMKERRSVWLPGCACDKPTAPCRVLDPFAGSGTVGAVCRDLGRDFVGVELNADYAAMADERIADPDYAKRVRKDQRAAKLAAKED